MFVEIKAKIEDKRIVQVFQDKTTNQEFCVHGIKLRWGCDECEDTIYEMEQESDFFPDGGMKP